MTTIPILLYHSVCRDPASWIAPFTVTPEMFAHHVKVMASSGRTALTVSELARALCGESVLPPRPLVVTFDDGFADFTDTARVLAAKQLPSTLYVTTGALVDGAPCPELVLPPAPMLSWSALPDLRAQGVEIGAHSHTHPQLDTLHPLIADDEIRHCKYLLEDALGEPVLSFAYPHGFHSARVRRAVERAGFTSACAVMNALSSGADRPFALARLTVRPSTTPRQFSAWLAGCDAPIAPYPERLRTKAWRAYRRIRGPAAARHVISPQDPAPVTAHPEGDSRACEP